MTQALLRALACCTLIACLFSAGCALSGSGKKVASTDAKKVPPKSSKTEVAAVPFWRRPLMSNSTASKSAKAAAKSRAELAQRSKQAQKDKTSSSETAQASKEKTTIKERAADVEKTDDKSVVDSTLDGFDETTRALIQAELRDADPEARAEMLSQLKGVQPEMVPRILNTWRLGMKYQSQAKKDKTKTSPASETRLASRDDDKSSRGAEGKKAPDTGLGNQNPWNVNYPPRTTAESAANAAQTPPNNNNSLALAQQMAGAMGANSPAAALSRQAPSAGNSSQNFWPGSQQNQGFPNGDPSLNLLKNAASPGGSQNPVQLGQPLAAVQAAAWATQQQQTIAQQNFTQTPATGQTGSQVTTIPTTLLPDQTSVAQIPNAPPGANQLQQTVAVIPSVNPQTLEAIQQMISLKEAEVSQMQPGPNDAEKQRYIEAHVHLRMFYMMAGQQQRALQPIPGIDAADQEFWQQVVWGMNNYFDSSSIPNSLDRASQTVAQFQTAGNRLREKARLELRNLGFCNKIDGFGDFERFPHDEFTPGQQLLIYAEVVNFRSEITADGRFRTLLKSSYEILRPGSQSEIIDHKKYDSIPDLCRNQRQDFYLNYETRLPQNLSPGPYILRLTVSDELAHKVTTQNINFTVR